MKAKGVFCLLLLMIAGLLTVEAEGSRNFLNNILNYKLEQHSQGEFTHSPLQDSAADRALYSKLEAHMRELKQITSNSADMLSYYRVQDASLGQLIKVMQEIRVLSIEAANSLYGEMEREIIYNRIDQFYREFFAILRRTEINRVNVYQNLLESSEFKKAFSSGNNKSTTYIDSLLKLLNRQRSLAGSKMSLLERSIKARERTGSSYSSLEEQKGLSQSHLIFLLTLLGK